MKYKLLSVSKSDKLLCVNIGDYIQALASSQFYPRIDGFIDRDMELNSYNEEPCKMIMNGWYLHNPLNWPPSDKINPLFVAFHINSTAKDRLLSTESLDYLKKHQPIGCRDLRTMELLQQKGVESYFSGCMTLTLGKKYHSDIKEDKTYIVDPFYDGVINFNKSIISIFEFIKNPFDIIKLLKNKGLKIHDGRNLILKFLKTSLYYREYRKIFGRQILIDSIYITQDSYMYQKQFHSDEERLKEAERLVKLYSRARLVITSRIHCALPCLGLETPVVYLQKVEDSEASSCRLDGLLDLFNIVKVYKGSLIPNFEIKHLITKDNVPQNKSLWKKYASQLCESCSKFILE